MRSRLPLLAAVGALAVGAIVATVVLNGEDSSAPVASASPTPVVTSTDGRVWMDAALEDFKPMKGVLVTYTKTLAAWQGGSEPGSAAVAVIDYALPQILATRTALEKRAAYAKAPHALDDYQLAVSLYVQASRVARVGGLQPTGALADQMKLEYGRLRTLADKVFDQGAVELAPYLPTPPVIDGVVLQKQPEVPSWPSLSLAAGPPLDVTAPVTARRTYQETRPEQSFEKWADAVSEASVPSASSVADALTTGAAADLRTLSDTLIAAADSIYAAADPKGERRTSTRLQLGLLVDAEATRAAQVATLLPGDARATMAAAAKALTVIGDRLWDSRLGPRDSGFSTELLTT